MTTTTSTPTDHTATAAADRWLATRDQLDAMLAALTAAGFTIHDDPEAGTLEATTRAGACVLRAVEKDPGGLWIAASAPKLFL